MRSLLFASLIALPGCAIVVDDASGGRNNLTGNPDGTTPGSGGACYAGKDPPFVTPREPTMSKDAACSATGERKETFASADEVLALMVGTWVPCSSSESWFLSHPGMVIGGDRTFRFLESKGGMLVPTEVLGRVKVIPTFDGHYQIDIERSDGTNMLHVTQIGVGDRVEVAETGGFGSLARIAPGAAAIPTTYTDSGKCSLVGVWDSQAGVGDFPSKTSGTFAFDGHGHFQGGALGADVCAPTITGTYRLVGDSFEVVTSTGMGCPSTYAAGWTVTFSADCKTANLAMKYDNCTGGRHSIEYDSVLTKK
jgi:hypothetical protein